MLPNRDSTMRYKDGSLFGTRAVSFLSAPVCQWCVRLSSQSCVPPKKNPEGAGTAFHDLSEELALRISDSILHLRKIRAILSLRAKDFCKHWYIGMLSLLFWAGVPSGTRSPLRSWGKLGLKPGELCPRMIYSSHFSGVGRRFLPQ